jgi:regulation of enolase protein 1 (concanavalin A-like superfamily)
MHEILGLAALAVACHAFAAPQQLTIDTLPFALDAQLDQGSASVKDKTLVLQANKGTDLFVNPDGAEATDHTPRVLFQPAGDFIFSAKVTAGFHKEFDGGALIVYGDKTHWAKLLFEYSTSGTAGVTSTVAKGVGDDAYHGVQPGNEVYLKVVRLKDMFVFYTSPDGKRWTMVRTFGMPGAATMKVGFSSQSPDGDAFSARFSDIKFRNETFKDYWQGE